MDIVILGTMSHWTRQPRETVGFPLLEVTKTHFYKPMSYLICCQLLFSFRGEIGLDDIQKFQGAFL